MIDGYNLEAVLQGESEVQIFTSLNVGDGKLPLGTTIPIIENIIDCGVLDIANIGVDNYMDILSLISRETGSIFCIEDNIGVSSRPYSVRVKRA